MTGKYILRPEHELQPIHHEAWKGIVEASKRGVSSMALSAIRRETILKIEAEREYRINLVTEWSSRVLELEAKLREFEK